MYSCLKKPLFFKEKFFLENHLQKLRETSSPAPNLSGVWRNEMKYILPFRVQNETKETIFNWCLHQNEIAVSF